MNNNNNNNNNNQGIPNNNNLINQNNVNTEVINNNQGISNNNNLINQNNVNTEMINNNQGISNNNNLISQNNVNTEVINNNQGVPNSNIFTKNAVIVAATLFIIIIFGLFIYNKFINNKNLNDQSGSNGVNLYKNTVNKNTSINEQVLYSSDEVEIKVLNMKMLDKYAKITFSLLNKSDKTYNFSIGNLKVNNCILPYGEPNYNGKLLNNFAGVNLGVSPGQYSDNYVIYIWYNELKFHKIDSISLLSFELLLYKDEKMLNQKIKYIDVQTSDYNENSDYKYYANTRNNLYSDDNIEIFFDDYHYDKFNNIDAVYLIIHNKTSRKFQMRNGVLLIGNEQLLKYNTYIDIIPENVYNYFTIGNLKKSFTKDSDDIKYTFSLYDDESKQFIKNIELAIYTK